MSPRNVEETLISKRGSSPEKQCLKNQGETEIQSKVKFFHRFNANCVEKWGKSISFQMSIKKIRF